MLNCVDNCLSDDEVTAITPEWITVLKAFFEAFVPLGALAGFVRALALLIAVCVGLPLLKKINVAEFISRLRTVKVLNTEFVLNDPIEEQKKLERVEAIVEGKAAPIGGVTDDVNFNNIYVNMSPGAFKLLKWLVIGPSTLDSVESMYSNWCLYWKFPYSKGLVKARWLDYLSSHGLITVDDKQATITTAGRDFLKYLVDRGFPLDKSEVPTF